jgi:hypothetical protein
VRQEGKVMVKGKRVCGQRVEQFKSFEQQNNLDLCVGGRAESVNERERVRR